MKASPPNRQHAAAYTLVELLLVIAIIILLVSMLLSGIAAVRESARRTKARSEVNAIRHAFQAYYLEYTRWPSNLVAGHPDNEGTPGIPVTASVLNMLSGQNLSGNNPRLLRFMEIPNSATSSPDGAYLDPWGQTNKYMCDFDNNGTLTLQIAGSTDLVDVAVGVWSTGRNRRDATPEDQQDDICTWR
jgi:type II secretory pathway pseudopilin PulG